MQLTIYCSLLKTTGNFFGVLNREEGLSEKVFNDMCTSSSSSKTEGKHFGLSLKFTISKTITQYLTVVLTKVFKRIVFIFPKTKKGLLIFTNMDEGHKLYGRKNNRILFRRTKEKK
jgi:hypothetical protein